MISKWKVNFMLVLCLISLLSIGFSSWSIASEERILKMINGGIETDNIIDGKDCIYFNEEMGDNLTGVECFKYSPRGYLSSEGTVTDKGYVRAFLVIDINNCKKLFGQNAKLNLTLTLKYADNNSTPLNIFAKDGNNRSLSYSVEGINESLYAKLPATGMQSRRYISSIDFDNLLLVDQDKIYITIVYEFFASVGDYFRNNIYTYLSNVDNRIDFSLSLFLREKI